MYINVDKYSLQILVFKYNRINYCHYFKISFIAYVRTSTAFSITNGNYRETSSKCKNMWSCTSTYLQKKLHNVCLIKKKRNITSHETMSVLRFHGTQFDKDNKPLTYPKILFYYVHSIARKNIQIKH